MRIAWLILAALAWLALTDAKPKTIVLRDPDAQYCVTYDEGNRSCVDLATLRAKLLEDAPPCDPLTR